MAISTTDKLVNTAAYVIAETPIIDKCANNVSGEYSSGSSDTIRVEVTSFPTVNNAMGGSDSDVQIPGVTVTLTPIEVKIPLTADEQTNDIENLTRQVLKPTGVAVAATLEERVIDAILRKAEFANVGTGTLSQLDDISRKIRDTKLGSELIAFGSNNILGKMRTNAVTTFGNTMGEKLYAGWVTDYDGYGIYRTSDMPVITTGVVPTVTSTVTTTISAQGATQMAINNLSSATGTVKKGTVFSVTGVSAVSLLRKDIGYLRQFIVLADATVTSSAATVTVAPIYLAGATGVEKALQNVSVTTIASGTLVIPVSAANTAYTMAVLFDPRLLAYGSKPFIPWEGVKSSVLNEGKVRLRYGVFGDGANGSQRHRFDGQFGAELILGKAAGIVFAPAA